jgi:hypothetical protein
MKEQVTKGMLLRRVDTIREQARRARRVAEGLTNAKGTGTGDVVTALSRSGHRSSVGPDRLRIRLGKNIARRKAAVQPRAPNGKTLSHVNGIVRRAVPKSLPTT